MSECNFADDQPPLDLRNTHHNPAQRRFDAMDIGGTPLNGVFTARAAAQDARNALYGYGHEVT